MTTLKWSIPILALVFLLLLTGVGFQNKLIIGVLETPPVRVTLSLLLILAVICVLLFVYFSVVLPRPRRVVLNTYFVFVGFSSSLCILVFGSPLIQSIIIQTKGGIGVSGAAAKGTANAWFNFGQSDYKMGLMAVLSMVVFLFGSIVCICFYLAAFAWEEGYDPITRKPLRKISLRKSS